MLSRLGEEESKEARGHVLRFWMHCVHNVESRVHLDGSVKAFQALPGDAIVREVAPVRPIVTVVLQENDECLTDGDVIGRSVVVQLLMPVLLKSKSSLRTSDAPQI